MPAKAAPKVNAAAKAAAAKEYAKASTKAHANAKAKAQTDLNERISQFVDSEEVEPFVSEEEE